jgi:hypothetical protein
MMLPTTERQNLTEMRLRMILYLVMNVGSMEGLNYLIIRMDLDGGGTTVDNMFINQQKFLYVSYGGDLVLAASFMT